ncbi:MAG: SDR family oxidoreductase [Proteobacteria bacterium]|nr:SDR family oxidoreductase [Pseudomonadota bacterium]HQR04250.1 SDR family oxidoreductase [Rhodocyclaceae bacterium]
MTGTDGAPGDPAATDCVEALWAAPTAFRADLFKDRVVLVSGGGSGIGRAIALLFARLGAKLAICGRTPGKLEKVAAFCASRGVKILTQPTDIRQPEQIETLLARIDAELGPLNIVVNNAGGQFPQPAIDFSHKGWNAVINNNLNGTWYMMQAAARYWRDHQRPGNIVNIVAPMARGMPGVAHTVAARAGVVGAMNTVAIEWAPLGIRVNCLEPGLTATEGLSIYPAAAQQEFPRANLFKRPATPLEVAEAAVFLASPAASFITGITLPVDGGYRLWGELWTAGRPDYFKFPAE